MSDSRRDLPTLVSERADRTPDAVAIWAPGRKPLTYAALNRQIREVVGELRELGIQRGDRVAVVLPDGPELAVAVVSVAAGAACAPLNPDYRASELDAHLARLGCRSLVVPAGIASPAITVARARGIHLLQLTALPESEAGSFTLTEYGHPAAGPRPHDREVTARRPDLGGPDDVALVLPTSGTSAGPKLVPLTHRNLCASAESIRSVLELVERDRCLNVMPLFHVHGLSTIFASLAAGASVICAGRFDAERFFEAMEALDPTWYTAAPAIHRAILDRAVDHASVVGRSALRFLRSASAPMPSALMADLERLFRVPFIEAYGMTEAGPQIASNRLPPAHRTPGSVGLAAGPDVAVMDEVGNLVPTGQAGEVVVRGPNVMLGYLNDPEADRAAFVRGWFRTGDRGRLDAQGHLFITGRLKEIINRGGEKISPREVDEVLLDHPAVAEAVTFPVPHATLDEDVAAAIVLAPGLELAFAPHPETTSAERLIQAIRQFAASRLADFKVPQRIVIVPAIPTGPTGKPRRSELAALLGLAAGGSRATEFVAPRTVVEERLSAIWTGILGTDRLGVYDNFFQAGGDSLKATQVMSRVAREFRLSLAPNTLFERPTIAELSDLVIRYPADDRPSNGALTDKGGIPRRTGDGPCPLSFAQRRLWLLDQMEPGDPSYNMHTALRLSGVLDEGSLERSLGEIVRRHEALRTTFRTIDGQPVQITSPARAFRLAHVDLTRLASSERRLEVDRLCGDEVARPFHLTHGPLLRATLLELEREEHVLLVTLHHIVSDGWSTTIFLRELNALYSAFAAGRPSPLPELAIQYPDFAAWQHTELEGEALDTQLAYWKRQLEGMPPLLDLPSDRRRPAVPTGKGASYSTPLSATLGEGLRSVSQRESVTPFMVALAAFQTLLHRHTGQSDIVVGTPVANRRSVEVEGLIGFFANTLLMRADLSGNPTFHEVLARVRDSATGAFAHQDLPFERLVDELQPQRDHRHNPLFQVMFAFQNIPEQTPLGSWSDLVVTPMDVARTTAKFDLTLYLSESPDGIRATWQYSTDLFDEARIARMAASFHTLLTGIVADPGARLSDLPVQSPDQQRESVTGWNQTAMKFPRDRFHQLFEDRARSAPATMAVRCGEEELTYGELDRRANRLAGRLRALGVGPDGRVGVCLHRSVEMVVAVLAVMKSGAAYVPLDPSYPAEHLGFVLDDASVSVLITAEDLPPLLGSTAAARTVVHVGSGSVECERGSDQSPEGGAPSDLAYVIYTSGSTGKPKGVMITHGNLSHYVHAMVEALRVDPDDCYLHTASFAFSSSVRQLAVPLAAGAKVVVASTETIRDPVALFGLIKRDRVSIVDIVPTYWRSCTRTLAALSPDARADLLSNDLRLILSASEPLGTGVPTEWDAVARHGARLINMYGQTETTGIVTVHPVSQSDADPDRFVPIGRPIANTRTYVLDAWRQPVPVGVWGELYVGGDGVGLGYLNDADLTAERFVLDPFDGAAGTRLYRTGDEARWLPNGDLELRGRLDHQLKVRGYRIEPALIEGVVGQHPDWRECVVLVQEDGTGEKRLVGCVAPNPGAAGSTRELREYLKRKLPDYMIPSRFVTVTALPRTPSGKIDRLACRARLAEPAAVVELADRPSPATNGNGKAASGTNGTQPLSTARAEAILTEIWGQILGVDQVSLDDNFFDLGGNSILALEMISRAARAGLRLTPRQLWQNQTIAELAPVTLAAAAPGSAGPVADPVLRDLLPRRLSRLIEDGPARVLVSAESLRAYGREALERAGLAAEGAAIVTEVQLEASLRDQPTHNVVSIPRYARRISAGTINPRPDIRIERQTGMSARIDGDNGPGQWVAMIAMETAIRMARGHGVGIVGVRRSNHLGAAGHYPWLAAREGLIGLCTTNGPVILAPTGGITPTFGNNPLAVGIPAGGHHPILLDIAMSVAPRGRIGLHLAEGKPLPPGWILDREGNPSTDPADLVAGLGVPIGGHKGYGLTLIMEVLAGVLTGASFGWDNRREHTPGMTKPADFGHFFMAIDPDLFISRADFTARVDQLIRQTKTGERAHDVDEILLPGEAELRARERSLRDGVRLRRSTYDALLKYASAAALETELRVVDVQDTPAGKTTSSGTD